MTLLELQRHVNEAIAQNQKRGWDERNAMPVLVQLHRRTRTGQIKSRNLPLSQVYRGQMGIATFGNQPSLQFGLTLHVEESEEIAMSRPRHPFEPSDIDKHTCGKCGKLDTYTIHSLPVGQQAWETAMGMRGFNGSAAEKGKAAK